MREVKGDAIVDEKKGDDPKSTFQRPRGSLFNEKLHAVRPFALRFCVVAVLSCFEFGILLVGDFFDHFSRGCEGSDVSRLDGVGEGRALCCCFAVGFC